jgi:hypothetical protein
MSRLQSILPTNTNSTDTDVEVVVVYRTPKVAHLISVWKEATGKDYENAHRKKIKTSNAAYIEGSIGVPNLPKWLCTGEWTGKMQYDISKIVASQTNPMGVADAFLKSGNNMKVVLADMSGMDDLSNVIVCEILQLPCISDGKVAEAAIMNQRSNPTDLGMTDAELEQVERILRQMDCYYYCGMRDKITVLHAKDEMFTSSQGWNQCCDSPSENVSPLDAYEQLRDLSCRAVGSSLTNLRNTTTIFEKSHQSIDTSVKTARQDLHEGLLESLLLPSFLLTTSFLLLTLVMICIRKCMKVRCGQSIKH